MQTFASPDALLELQGSRVHELVNNALIQANLRINLVITFDKEILI